MEIQVGNPRTHQTQWVPLDQVLNRSTYKRGGGGYKCTSNDCMAGTLIFVLVLASAACVLGGFALAYSLYNLDHVVHSVDAVITTSPFAVYLDATTPLAMQLPNDLQNYIGRTFNIYSRSAQMHTITLPAGTLTTTWDGASTIAKFGGAIGDGLTFHVFDRDSIAVISNTNVVFS